MQAPLSDGFGRAVHYLRVSVTDRCDLRCSYCMKEDVTFLPKADILSLEELERLCSTFVDLGLRKLRVTGGEPLVRRGIGRFFAAMGAHLRAGRLEELTLTTNGTQLAQQAQMLADSGVRRVNVSLDTLRADRFARLTRLGRIETVFAGIAAAQAAGLRVKLNAMALRGVNEDELFDLTGWAAARGCDLTFIELMPMGDIPAGTRLAQFWPLDELRARLETRFRLIDRAETTGGPARYVTVAETGQKIGFISPLSHNFCTDCNRVRVTCKGELYPCLGQDGATDLRPVLRAGTEGAALAQAIRAAIARKPAGHAFGYGGCGVAGAMARGMNHTGG